MSKLDPRLPLSRERLASAALVIIDAEGISGLSMRRLGAELGVEAMSLYHYIANKEDLLNAVVDVLYEEIELPVLSEGKWPEGFRSASYAFYRVLTRHPNAIELITTHSGRSETTLGVMNWSWASFRAAGLSEFEALTAFRLLVSFLLGFASTQVGVFGDTENNTLPVDADVFAGTEVEEMVEIHGGIRPSELFSEGLEVLISGIENKYGIGSKAD